MGGGAAAAGDANLTAEPVREAVLDTMRVQLHVKECAWCIPSQQRGTSIDHRSWPTDKVQHTASFVCSWQFAFQMHVIQQCSKNGGMQVDLQQMGCCMCAQPTCVHSPLNSLAWCIRKLYCMPESALPDFLMQQLRRVSCMGGRSWRACMCATTEHLSTTALNHTSY